jgi:predicted TIM-barrel fold metal-dependent hydrolase
MLNDAHCHFFSQHFFAALARQRGDGSTADTVLQDLQWDAPGSAEELATRWVRELDTCAVSRTALIASAPDDEESVAAAVRAYPSRLVGFFMLDASSAGVVDRARHAITELGLRAMCLFPAMHHVALHDDRVMSVVEAAAAVPGTAVFVHCGLLSVGVRQRLGLASRFDLRLGDPLAVSRLALTFPGVPFIIPHFGAGLLRETLMAADAASNIYLDTSSSNAWVRYTPGLALHDVFRSALSVVGPSRLLFGTDSSFFPRGWQHGIYDLQKNIVSALGIAPDAQQLIFGGNFDRLFPTGDNGGGGGNG